MNADSLSFLDGNAAAGELSDIFAVEVTTAVGRCAGCGHTTVLAEARLYVRAPGMVARCGRCDDVLFRMVKGPGRTWLDLRGLAYVQLAMPDQEDGPTLA
ncbi:MAG: DUF6510 family protein [Acidimicrobiales bacterium]